MNAIYLDNFVKSRDIDVVQSSVDTHDHRSFIDIKGHTLPVEETSLIENVDFENEVEVELDVLPSIEIVPYYYYSFKNPSNVFLNVYYAHSFTVIKTEFLDIFSPPPNC